MGRPDPGVSVPGQLVVLLREISEELARLGDHAADQAADTRAAALTITLEAVKAGIPPGKLRELAQRLRQDATHAAERIAHDRARLTLRIGQAIARASTLAREADLLEPTRQRASLLAGLVWQARRELELTGPRAADGPLFTTVERSPGRLDAARALRVRGGPGVQVLHEDRVLTGQIRWHGAVRDAWLAGDTEAWFRALASPDIPVRVPRRPDPHGPRVWLLVRDHAVASSHPEEVPAIEIPDDRDTTVVEHGRRRIAVVRLPPLVDGLQDWHVVAMVSPRLREATPRKNGGGEVILFPGMR